MKCLSIRQPWATLIILGVKRIENRSWETAYRGPLLIHASTKLDYDWDDLYAADEPIGRDTEVEIEEGKILPPIDSLPFGAIIGVVNVVDCRRFEDLPAELQKHQFANEGCWCRVLEAPKPLDEPFPCKGRLQLWNPPDDFKLP